MSGQQVPLSAAATQCTGTATHGAFWILNLTASGQTLQVPAYVDDVPLTVPLSDIANNTIQICLPPPDVPAGTPGRATFGAKLVSATFISEVFSVPPGSYTWRAVVTPYTPGRGTANPAGTVEAQSVDRTPQQVTIAGRAVKGKARTVRVTGRVRAADERRRGRPRPGAARHPGARTGDDEGGWCVDDDSADPDGDGTPEGIRDDTQRRAQGACTASFPPVPCAGKTFGGFVALSPRVRVRG